MERTTLMSNLTDIDLRIKSIHIELDSLHDMKDDILEQLKNKFAFEISE